MSTTKLSITHPLAALGIDVEMRVSEIPEADEVSIELGERCGDIKNLVSYHSRVVGGEKAFLKSVTRRAKYEFFLWKVIAEEDVGYLPKEIVYQGRGIGWDTPYRILYTKPEEEAQITPKTSIIMKLWDCGHQDCPTHHVCYGE